MIEQLTASDVWVRDQEMRCLIHNMRLSCGMLCPRCGAELWHFTLRGFPICPECDWLTQYLEMER